MNVRTSKIQTAVESTETRSMKQEMARIFVRFSSLPLSTDCCVAKSASCMSF